MKITFGNHAFLLHPSGILFWPDKSMAIVSDLHLEKGSHYAQKGFFLPPYDTHETLERLHATLLQLSPRRVLVLGDTFHDEGGHARLSSNERLLFDQLMQYDPLWITGNHDGEFVPEGFTAYRSLRLDNITFNHELSEEAPFEISGHFHPKVDIFYKEAAISRRCFIEDGNKMILPAFGAYAGGLSVSQNPLRTIFKNPRVYALGKKIYAVKI